MSHNAKTALIAVIVGLIALRLVGTFSTQPAPPISSTDNYGWGWR